MALMNEAGLCELTGDRAHVLAEYTEGDKAELTERYQLILAALGGVASEVKRERSGLVSPDGTMRVDYADHVFMQSSDEYSVFEDRKDTHDSYEKPLGEKTIIWENHTIPTSLVAGDIATIGVELVTIDYPPFLRVTDMIGGTSVVPDELQNTLASFSQDRSASTEGA